MDRNKVLPCQTSSDEFIAAYRQYIRGERIRRREWPEDMSISSINAADGSCMVHNGDNQSPAFASSFFSYHAQSGKDWEVVQK